MMKVVDTCGPLGAKNIGNYIAFGWFTGLKNHPRRGWTWKSPGDRTRNQIETR